MKRIMKKPPSAQRRNEKMIDDFLTGFFAGLAIGISFSIIAKKGGTHNGSKPLAHQKPKAFSEVD